MAKIETLNMSLVTELIETLYKDLIDKKELDEVKKEITSQLGSKVEKVDGKELVSTADINQITTNKNNISNLTTTVNNTNSRVSALENELSGISAFLTSIEGKL